VKGEEEIEDEQNAKKNGPASVRSPATTANLTFSLAAMALSVSTASMLSESLL